MDKADVSRRTSLALGLSALFAGAARADESPWIWVQVDDAATKLVSDHGSPAVSVSIRRQGRFVYSRAFGWANLETRTPAKPTSVFRIGSITKQFTAAALMALSEEGKLSVDDPLARFFPDFPRAGEITLRQMLTHTSGLGNYTDAATESAFVAEARLDYDDDALYRLMRSQKPLYAYEPGTVWAYSNTAYVLLGLIVQKAAGEPYGVFYKRRLFDRAGLSSTAVDDAADVVPARASGYTPRPGAPGTFDNASFISMSIPGGAGSMRSTSEDLCVWHEALFAGSVVSKDSVRQMITPHRLKDGSLPKPPAHPGDASAAKPVEYGFGLGVETIQGRRAVGHDGGIFGFISKLETFPDVGTSFAILFNCDGGATLRAESKALSVVTARAALI